MGAGEIRLCRKRGTDGAAFEVRFDLHREHVYCSRFQNPFLHRADCAAEEREIKYSLFFGQKHTFILLVRIFW